MLLAYLLRELRMFWTMKLTRWMFLLDKCHVFSHLIKNAPGWSLFREVFAGFLQYFLSQYECLFHQFSKRQRNNPCVEIPLKQVSHLLQRTQRSFNLQGKSFWWGRNANGIVFTGYLQKEHIINIEHLRKTIETKRPGKLTKWFLLHRVNAPAHNYLFSVTAVCAVCDCGFELVDQLPYSPDYHLGTSIAVMTTSYLLLITF